MKKCCTCKEVKDESEFSEKSKRCRKCVRIFNRKFAEQHGVKEKFIPIVTDTHKQCGICKELKLLTEFTNTPRGRMGKAAYCKPCMSQYQLQYTSPEERRINTQRYRDENREWWRSNHRITQFKRRFQIEALSDGSVTREFIERTYEIEICYYCLKSTPREYRTLEHRIPLTRGGLHSVTNIVMACLGCNCSKADKTEEEYKQFKLCRSAQKSLLIPKTSSGTD